METEEPQTEQEQAGRQDNVIRLPRDWLGPREQLVPFGPRADETVETAVPSAADFWGEGSASIQDALQGPAVEVERVRADVEHRVAVPGRSRRASYAVGNRATSPGSRIGARGLWTGAASLGAISVLAVGAVVLGSPAAGPRLAPLAVIAPGLGQDLGLRAGDLHRVAAGVNRLASSRIRQAGRTAIRSRPRTVHRDRGTAGGSSTAASGTAVYTRAVASATPASSRAVSSSRPSVSGSAAGASRSSKSSGPVGPGAPFGPGTLG